jgi:adenylate kinase
VVEAMETGGYLLDGFPRTLAQAERAFEAATQGNMAAEAVLFLDVPDDIAIERLVERSSTSGRVDDASTDVIRHRLEVFHEQTYPLLDFYRSNDRLVTVDAGKPPDEVFDDIVAQLEARRG